MSDDSSGSAPSSEGTTRRRLLTVMGAGGAAALATVVSSKEAQAGHDSTNTFHLGEVNTNPSNPTRLNAAAGEGAALEISGNPGGAGLVVNAAQSVFNGTGEAATLFVTPGGPDVPAIVVGGGETSGGLIEAQRGDLDEGVCITGVSGMDPPGGGPGTGVQGLSGTGVGVHGVCPDGFALRADGKSAFSTAGAAVVPTGQSSVFVTDADVTGDSHISVTLVSDPGERAIRWVDRNPGSGFTVHLSSAPPNKRPQTSLTYLIVEPASS